MTTPNNPDPDGLLAVADEIRRGQRFVITSHARPDGDSIGSSLGLAYALRAWGKAADVVHRDPPPAPYLALPGVPAITIAAHVDGDYDAAIVLECSDLARTGLSGLDRYRVLNVDHHPGNSSFGAVNWFNAGAAACAEMVFDLIETIGAPLTSECAAHLYLGILTDTGSFHFSHITPRTFDIARRLLLAGVDPTAIARIAYDSNSLGKLKLLGALLHDLVIEADGRLAVLHVDDEIFARTGGVPDDTDGVINLPLTVKTIEASIFFKHIEGDEYRVSLRSKGDVDVGAVARRFGGGGHKNAAGCTVRGPLEEVRREIVSLTTDAVTSVS